MLIANSKLKYHAVVFDLDGVLIDSEPYYLSLYENLYKYYAIDFTNKIRNKLAGISSQEDFFVIHEHWQELGQAKDLTVHNLRELYSEINSNLLPDLNKIVFGDAELTLRTLLNKGYRLALASSSPQATITHVLHTLKLNDYFEVIVSGESFAQSKPHPEIYIHTVEQLGLCPAKCIAVEDSTYGIRSALTAGLTVAAVKDNRYNFDQSKAQYLVNNLTELVSILS